MARRALLPRRGSLYGRWPDRRRNSRPWRRRRSAKRPSCGPSRRQQLRRLDDRRPETERALELVAEIETLALCPHLLQVEQRYGADVVMDLALGFLPQRHLLLRRGGAACPLDLVVGDGAVRDVARAGRRPDDGARMVELAEIGVGDREARGAVEHQRAHVLADLTLVGRVIDHAHLELDADLGELGLDD